MNGLNPLPKSDAILCHFWNKVKLRGWWWTWTDPVGWREFPVTCRASPELSAFHQPWSAAGWFLPRGLVHLGEPRCGRGQGWTRLSSAASCVDFLEAGTRTSPWAPHRCRSHRWTRDVSGPLLHARLPCTEHWPWTQPLCRPCVWLEVPSVFQEANRSL